MAQNKGISLLAGVAGLGAIAAGLRYRIASTTGSSSKKPKKKRKSARRGSGNSSEDEDLSRSGLPNLGNTCFVNCMLQALRSCQSFRTYIHDVSMLRGSDRDGFVRRFIECVEGNTTGLRAFLAELEREIRPFRVFRQQDAFELFNYLLEILDSKVHNSMPSNNLLSAIMGPPGGLLSEEKSFDGTPFGGLTSPFEGLVASFLKCQKCKKWSAVQHEKFNSISLSAPMYEEGLHLCDLLDEYTRSEELDGVNCDICSAQKTLKQIKKELKKIDRDIQQRQTSLSNQGDALTDDEETQRLYQRKSDFEVQQLLLQHHVENGIDPTDGEILPLNVEEDNQIKPQRVSNEAEKQYLFARLPTAICFHIKRLLGEGKNNANITFDEVLSLHEYVAEASKKYRSSFAPRRKHSRSSSEIESSRNDVPSPVSDPIDSFFASRSLETSLFLNDDEPNKPVDLHLNGDESSSSSGLKKERILDDDKFLWGSEISGGRSRNGIDFEGKEVKEPSRLDFEAEKPVINGFIHHEDGSLKSSSSKIRDASLSHEHRYHPSTPQTSNSSHKLKQNNSSQEIHSSSHAEEQLQTNEIDAHLNPKYELFAVVVHSGKSGNGHFTTYRKKLKHERADTNWVRCSDNHVVGVTIDEVKSCEAYILFYELLINPSPD